MGSWKSAPLHRTATKGIARPECATGTGFPAGRPPGRTRRRRVPPRAASPDVSRLEKHFVSRSRRPFSECILSLPGPEDQLAKAVQCCVLPQKVFQNCTKQVCASFGEMSFIQLHFHPGSPRKTDAVLRNDPGEMTFA